MAKKITRLKAVAASCTPQTREQVINDIKNLGDIQREMTRLETQINDEIARLTHQHAADIEAMKARITLLQRGIQTWCEANREELTQNGKTKTANLITGEVSWRNRPPSVSLKEMDDILQALEENGQTDCIIRKAQLDKNALLKKQDTIQRLNIPGITFRNQLEDFIITPFGQEVTS
ncbi:MULTISPECIES: host-nuclease inhibitor Gam family protein [unclassified Arsenophonus]|uniref:host-nuclease inhibitor Gam family protein n=1 Tax=unclassified Arsenophonus TaxID=2627083 RepID=UPI002856EC9B|nr:host-nuclease inhibitor Gam family protein [Arsenophonus sp.]MDR5609788.1 host-nuclease inhibitor Gam family protein [Arsenophonus sp.]MDR5613706.1 host-nuclease inhibitor Gam family protein [Arsenophonus sp.]